MQNPANLKTQPSPSREGAPPPHVVADPLSTKEPWLEAAIDWDATLAYRRHLWSWGFGVAEAMDTAQRGNDWPSSLERSRSPSRRQDHCWREVWSGREPTTPNTNLDGVIRAYEEQCGAIEKLGGRSSSWRAARSRRANRPTTTPRSTTDLFASQAAGDHPLARRDVRSGARRLQLGPPCRDGGLPFHPPQECGEGGRNKISLLDEQKEIDMRRKLPKGVRMYTGDDFNFAELIEGDAQAISDALLGISMLLRPPLRKRCSS